MEGGRARQLDVWHACYPLLPEGDFADHVRHLEQGATNSDLLSSTHFPV